MIHSRQKHEADRSPLKDSGVESSFMITVLNMVKENGQAIKPSLQDHRPSDNRLYEAYAFALQIGFIKVVTKSKRVVTADGKNFLSSL